VRLLVKNLGKRMPEGVVRDELENKEITVQGVLKLRLRRREQETSNARQLIPHFIVSVAKGPDVAKVHSHRTV
jgi:hypothetical protein